MIIKLYICLRSSKPATLSLFLASFKLFLYVAHLLSFFVGAVYNEIRKKDNRRFCPFCNNHLLSLLVNFGRAISERAGNNVYVGAFTLPHVEVAAGGGPGGGAEQLEQMIQQVISSMVDIGRQATVVSQGASPEDNNVNYHINIGMYRF